MPIELKGSTLDGFQLRALVYRKSDALPKDPWSLKGNRPLRVTFNTDVSGTLPWTFKPAQKHVTVLAGQTSLAFFEATNHSDEPIIGVATYNVVPNEAGAYFNKIQCFCFDEQRLLPGETVDMPVFFYIDPEFLDDRRMSKLDSMTLSYTFFKSNEIYGTENVPLPQIDVDAALAAAAPVAAAAPAK